MGSGSLDRKQAAAWCRRITRQEMSDATLKFWEQQGFLRSQRPGYRVPARYGLADLVRVRVVAEMRRDGLPPALLKRALCTLGGRLPELVRRPSSVALTSAGRVVPASRKPISAVVTSRRGSGFAWVCDLGHFVDDARVAIAEAR